MRKLRHEEIPRIKPADSQHKARHPIVAIIDNVRSIHNVGAFFRTADGAWIERIILTGITGTPDNRAMHKTALGAQDTISWEYVPEPGVAINRLKSEGYTVFALELTDSPVSPDTLSLDAFPLALVVGNELTGVQDEVLALCDGAIEIPQYGTKQSLNVSVAYGITLFDLVRRYRALKELPMFDDPFPRPAQNGHADG